MTRGGDAAAAWKQGSPSSNLWSAFRRADASHWSDRVAVTSGWVGLQADIALDPQGNATAVWSSSATVSASFKPEGKPWQDDYLLSHYEDFAVYPAVAMHRPRTAMAVWVRSGDEDDRIQSVLYDIDTSAKEAEPGDEGDGGDEGDDGGDEGEQFRGTAQADKLVGTPGNDVFYGLGGNDTIDGRGGRDVAYGGPGNDRIVGGRGADRLFGGPGRDQISGYAVKPGPRTDHAADDRACGVDVSGRGRGLPQRLGEVELLQMRAA